MPPIKVCCFCESWESGGIESFLCNVLCRMDPDKAEIDLVASCLKDSIFTAPMQAHGIRFYELSGSQRKLFQNYSLFQRLLRERQYDVLHLNAFQGLSLYYLHLAKRVPVRIAHSHNTGLRRSRTRPFKLLFHNLAKRLLTKDATDLWACSAPAAAFLFPRQDLHKVQWIPNGIETERFRYDPDRRRAVRDRLGLTGNFVIGNIGRLCEQKNQGFLLEVFSKIIERRPECRLLLVGTGENEKKLKEKAAGLGISGKILFYGAARDPEELFWAMDVFAFPSRFEGLGIAAVEAQAAGLPVFASERIPPEVRITPLFHSIPLSAGAAFWADSLLGAPARTPDAADLVRDGGFDIQNTVGLVRHGYENR